jgi:hypothetical protein
MGRGSVKEQVGWLMTEPEGWILVGLRQLVDRQEPGGLERVRVDSKARPVWCQAGLR